MMSTPTTSVLRSGDVAAMFGVTTHTVKRWADTGLLPFFRTPGGHYRYRLEDVHALMVIRSPLAPTVATQHLPQPQSSTEVPGH